MRILLLSLMLSCRALAAGSAHSNEIPWDLITAQTVNFSLFIAIMFFILRKPAKEHFTNFRNEFLEQSEKAKSSATQAERLKKEAQDRLDKLETTYSTRIDQAKKDALSMKQNLVGEANTRAEQMLSDASANTLLMFKSAERTIQAESLSKALDLAKEELSKKVGDQETQRLHSEFLEEIRVNNL